MRNCGKRVMFAQNEKAKKVVPEPSLMSMDHSMGTTWVPNSSQLLIFSSCGAIESIEALLRRFGSQ